MQKPRKWLSRGGLAREDSDDELGSEDHPWEWIYERDGNVSCVETKSEVDKVTPRKRKASALNDTTKKPLITGARMATFVVEIGDAVLLKSPEQGKDWVGLVVAFSDTDEDGDEEMCAHIQWFCTPEELAGGKKSKARNDALPNESYITADFNMNPLAAINGKATVLSKDAFFKKYPGGKMPRSKAAASQYAKTILCRQGVKQRNMKYTSEFVWEEIFQGPESLLGLVNWIQNETKGKRQRISSPMVNEDTEYQQTNLPTDEKAPATPKKRRKTTSATPKSSTKSLHLTTPTHQRIKIKKPLEFTPLGTRILSPSTHLSTPYSKARSTLHVSAVPASLPCRESEFATVYAHLHSAITEGSGSCIYISGTPGTGKTATVRDVVSQLQHAVLTDELDDFNFVEINGMKVTDPHQSYAMLWEALKGDRVSPAHALSLLEHEFSHPSPRRIPCVVLMDELDQLVTKNQSVMYNFFNWPVLRHSRLIVLAVANTMDLPERTLSNKISSRLGLTRITFPGYTHTQLMNIISSRLEGVPGDIVEKDAVQFAARKVAAVSGDARRCLDICRRAVEIAEQQAKEGDDEASEHGPETTPSKTGRNGTGITATPRNGNQRKIPRVTIATIKQAINEATLSPLAQHLRALPLAAKLFLAALMARSRRTGVSESTLGDVLIEAKRIADVAEEASIRDLLRMEHQRGELKNGGGGGGSYVAIPRVLAMGAAALELVDAGIVAMEARARGEKAGKVRLRVGDEEIKSALIGDIDARGMGFNA